MLGWIRARIEARNARELRATMFERHAALAREKAVREQLDAALRDIVAYKEKLGHMAEISGELSKRRSAMAKELETTRIALMQSKDLIDELRTVPELALELARESGKIIAYERAEVAGIERERSAIFMARGALRGMSVAKKVAESRASILMERMAQLRGTAQVTSENTSPDDEDTKRFTRPKLVK